MTQTKAGELIRGAMARSPVLQTLPPQAVEELATAARMERYKKPTLLGSAGEPITHLRYVIEGHLDLVGRTAAGGEFTVASFGRGTWATWLACFDSEPPVHDFYSSAQTAFIAFPTKAVRGAISANPACYPLIIAEIGKRFRNILEWTEQSALLNRHQRLAKLLVILARNAGVTGNQATVHTTQDHLAGLARCSRQTANKTLQTLEAAGLIDRQYRGIAIPDLSALAAYAAKE